LNVLHIAYYTILRNIRDWKYLLLLIVAPIFIILITGVSTDHIDKLKITEKANVLYFSEDTGDIAKGFNSFIQVEQVKAAFDVQKVASLEEGMEKVKAGKAEAFIHISKNFSEDSLNGKKTRVEVYSSKAISSVKPLIESYINNINTSRVIKTINKNYVVEESISSVDETPISPIGVVPNGVDRWTYYNMLIFLFYGAILSGYSIINEIKKNTISRVNSMPINSIANITGKILGDIVTLFSCSVLMIVFTKYIFNSNWNGNILSILLTFFLYCIIVICFGIIVALLTKKIGITVLIVMCSNVLLFMFSGGAWNISGGVLTKVSLISPHFYVTQALTNNIFNGLTQRVNSSIFSLAIMAALLLLTSIFLGRRKVR
jgi:ABC-2 type transport system permease protein